MAREIEESCRFVGVIFFFFGVYKGVDIWWGGGNSNAPIIVVIMVVVVVVVVAASMFNFTNKPIFLHKIPRFVSLKSFGYRIITNAVLRPTKELLWVNREPRTQKFLQTAFCQIRWFSHWSVVNLGLLLGLGWIRAKAYSPSRFKLSFQKLLQ